MEIICASPCPRASLFKIPRLQHPPAVKIPLPLSQSGSPSTLSRSNHGTDARRKQRRIHPFPGPPAVGGGRCILPPGLDRLWRPPGPHRIAAGAVRRPPPMAGRRTLCRAAGPRPGTARSHVNPDGGRRRHRPRRTPGRPAGPGPVSIPGSRHHGPGRAGHDPLPRRGRPSGLAGRGAAGHRGPGGGGGLAAGHRGGEHALDHGPDAPGRGGCHPGQPALGLPRRAGPGRADYRHSPARSTAGHRSGSGNTP